MLWRMRQQRIVRESRVRKVLRLCGREPLRRARRNAALRPGIFIHPSGFLFTGVGTMHLILAAFVLCADPPALDDLVRVPHDSTSEFAGDIRGPSLAEQLHAVAQSHRERSGLPRQELDPELNAISQRWAERMARENSMYHGGGENIIAYGTATPEATVQMWINSPGHRAFVLGNNTRAGWGAARASNGTWYWAGAFRNHQRPVAKLDEAGKIAGKATARTVSAPVRFARNRIGRRR